MIVSTPREALWAFVNSRLGTPWSSDFRAIGLIKNDCLVGAVGYNGFTGRSCILHSAIDDPSAVHRTFVQAMFDYPFNQCGLTHLMATVDSGNSRSLEVCRRLGFKEVHRLEGAGLEGGDIILLQMLRTECRWIKRIKDGKELSPAA